MTGRKRSRNCDDDDGEVEFEVESASSSFRQNDANHKRTKVAMAQAMGGAVESDDEADFDELLMEDVDVPRDDSSEHDYTLRQDSSDNEIEDDAVDEIKATQFVERKLREHKENVAADSGVIESVYMRNFMCHPNLTINLGPLINFIIGHNGSGKSAVLTALQISLGNRASGTNRAKTLKDMIKTGSDSGMVGVKIRNRGENAYKPELFGTTITVERHFTKSGSSVFKLKSTDGRIITTKRGELEDVLDHFALQMDNPINVLTQDLSRRFLSNSTPAEKYRFFIKGTQLEALDADYNILEEHYDSVNIALGTRTQMIADLKEKEVRAHQNYKRADRVQDLENRMRDVRRQLSWIQVEGEEKTLDRYKADLATAEEQVREHEGIAEEVSNRFEAQDTIVEAAQRAVEAHSTNLPELQEVRDAAREKFDENKAALLKHKAEERIIKDNFKTIRKNAAQTEIEITEERKRLTDENGDAHNQRLKELDRLKEQAKEAKQAFDEHNWGSANVEQAVKDAHQRYRDSTAPVEAAKREEDDARTALNRVSQEQGRKWAPYHGKMEALCTAIDRETRFRTKPVGPMGLHVQLLKPEWSSLVEVTFGNSLDSFVVTSKYDQDLLQSLSKRIGCPANAIIVHPHSFSTAGKEPEDDSDTILRVLRIDNPLVRQALVVNHSAEQTVLISNIEQGKTYMFDSGRRRNVRAVLTMAQSRGDGQRWEWSRSGDQKSSGIRKLQRQPRMKADREHEIQARQADLQSARRALDQAKQNETAARSAHEKAKQALELHKRESRRMKQQYQQADDDVEKLQNDIEINRPQDGKLTALTEQHEEMQRELETIKQSLEDSANAQTTLDENARKLKDTLEEAQAKVTDLEQAIKAAQTKLERCQNKRHDILVEKNAKLADVQQVKAHVERIQVKVTAQEKLVADWIEEARKESESERVRIDEGMTYDTLVNRFDRLKADFENVRKRMGGTREELMAAYLVARQAVENANHDTKKLRDEAETMRQTLTERRRRWGLFRKYISMRTRIQFNYLLSERSFRGRVLLDHVDKSLDIHVEPDMTKASDSGRQAKTLSGGEKSFSTICLLLSIWEAMGSPIRCLDEFDVYMDSVNRAQSMGLMIETARRSVGRQFILITPQSMSNVNMGDDVHIHKMADPERREPGQRGLDEFI